MAWYCLAGGQLCCSQGKMPLAGCDGGQALPPYLSARLPLVNVREEGPGAFSQNRAMLMVHTCRWVGYWLARSFHASGRSSRVFALSRASSPAWRTWSKHDWSCRSHQKCFHWSFYTVVFNALVSGGRRTASLCRGGLGVCCESPTRLRTFWSGKGPVVASPSDICRVHGAPTTASRVQGQTKLEINGK